MTNRECGPCQLCCELVPVEEIGKPAGRKCVQQCGAGCAVYASRPLSCRMWSCQWLTGAPGTESLERPDQSHYVVDPMPDQIVVGDRDGGESIRLQVVQVWVDPAHPDAHEDPALRAYVERLGQPAIIRYDSHRAVVLFPPSVSPTGEWMEHATGVHQTRASFNKTLRRTRE